VLPPGESFLYRTTPFHRRVEPANTTGLWSHWAGYLVADKYQLSEKFEYLAVRNAVGVFDTSPLYKYRISGPGAERYLSGVLTRNIRRCRPGEAQYTVWCDDRGFVVEDGVVLRHGTDEFLLTAARPNLSYLRNLVGYEAVEIEDVSDQWGILAVQGPAARTVLEPLAAEIASLGFFELAPVKLGGTAVTVSRTGYTGGLGYEIWVPAEDAVTVWDEVAEAGAGHGLLPFGQVALLMARIEAGLLLIDVDFESSRFAFNDEHRSTPLELGLGWMVRDLDDDRPFVGRNAIAMERAEKTSRWRITGLVVDWRQYESMYTDAGLLPPKDHIPVTEEFMLYGEEGERVGYATSFMYSPMLQRHIAIARVLPHLAAAGTRVDLEVTVNHRYERVGATVTRMPVYNPAHKTA
ncbi:MAG: aminomethyltransferase family protein, partial [Actinomycetota bacterium]|nr:aminomethyltransferase family protein [Actinomycetota bacterium]